jgi:hypothetical protein
MRQANIQTLTAALAVLVGACGGQQAPAAHRSASASSVRSHTSGTTATAPTSALALGTGTAAQQIIATATAFYRAVWQDQPRLACSLFSPRGRAGFMHAAKVSFPASVNGLSTCVEAMRIYHAALEVSVATLRQSDPAFNPATLDRASFGQLRIEGSRASADGPLNTEPEIKPKRLAFVRLRGRWLIDGSSPIR